MQNVTLGFGRSIGHKHTTKRLRNIAPELNDWQWGEFRHELRNVVEECGGTVHFSGTGTGYWEGEEEEAGCIAFFADDSFAWTAFRTALRILCRWYLQDAIAVTAAESELIG